MLRWRMAALAVLVIAAGCQRRAAPQDDAAVAVQGFLEAVMTADTNGFEAAIDRPALRADLRRQLVDVGRGRGLDVDGGPSNAALDRMIGPSAFRVVDAAGAPLAGVPSRAQAAALVKPLGKDRVCLHDLTAQAGCLLTFVREPAAKNAKGSAPPAAWRLVQMPAQDLAIAVPPEPAPAEKK